MVEAAPSPDMISDMRAFLAKHDRDNALTEEDCKYLKERGWRENGNGTWSDMNVPPDIKEEMSRIPQRDGTEKVITQVKTGGPIGWAYPAKEALALEHTRDREPVPMYEKFLTRVGGDGKVVCQRWHIRDRQRQVVAGPLESEGAADEWIQKNS